MEPFPEVTEQQLIRMRWNETDAFAVYFYTPWCGTCKMGEKMLSIASTLAPDLKVVKSNVNFLPGIVSDWKIESVPCLAFVEGSRVSEKLYTMRSVDFLLAKMRDRVRGSFE